MPFYILLFLSSSGMETGRQTIGYGNETDKRKCEENCSLILLL